MTVYFHEEDLPEGALGPGAVAVDTETMGLNPLRDRLCLVQISDGPGDEHLVRLAPGSAYDAPVLKAVLADTARLKPIGRASCGERECQDRVALGGTRIIKKKKQKKQ